MPSTMTSADWAELALRLASDLAKLGATIVEARSKVGDDPAALAWLDEQERATSRMIAAADAIRARAERANDAELAALHGPDDALMPMPSSLAEPGAGMP